MEKYMKPEMTVDNFQSVDVLTTSTDMGGDSSNEPTTRPNSTPYIPIP
ncbi:MAG: hypothetical protein J5964_06850 [Eubacterium sp.]|nr:hypothetical protein [Eubacterium sp.]